MDFGDSCPIFSNWIWDFLLRHPLDNRTLKSLITALPPPDDASPNLKKLLLLKKLESDSISETTLDLLALLAQTGAVSDTMRAAFCAAAVECTVNNFNSKAGNGVNKRYKLFDAVESVWKGKIEGMKKSVGNGGLSSKALWEWEKEIKRGIWDDGACESVVEKCSQVNGVEAVNAYIREEREKMGPSFLEVVAERVRIDENLQRVLGVAGKEASLEEMKEGKIKSKQKQVCSRGISGNPGGANIVDHKSIDGSQEGRDMKPKKRRKNRSWSIQEENVLRNAVEKHGKGNWSVILLHNRDNFVDRTDVDLKDKYRNLTTVSKTPRF